MRRFQVKRWIACRLEFKDRRRVDKQQPGRYTELFFLDEATAFAAGHRPCAECRRDDYNRFLQIVGESRAAAVDERLHAERLAPSSRAALGAAARRGRSCSARASPGSSHGDALLRWSTGRLHGAPSRALENRRSDGDHATVAARGSPRAGSPGSFRWCTRAAEPRTPLIALRLSAAALVPGDADQLRFGLDEPEVRAWLVGRTLAAQAPWRRRIPRETVHACTPCVLSEGAGALVILMSPLTVLARISTSGPSPAGTSPESSSSDRVSPLTVLQSRKTFEPRRTPIETSPETVCAETSAPHDRAVVLVAADGVDVDVVVGLADRHVARGGVDVDRAAHDLDVDVARGGLDVDAVAGLADGRGRRSRS